MQSVENLKLGQTTAPEYKDVSPVPLAVVLKTLPFIKSNVIRDMVRVQLHIGGRPQAAKSYGIAAEQAIDWQASAKGVHRNTRRLGRQLQQVYAAPASMMRAHGFDAEDREE